MVVIRVQRIYGPHLEQGVAHRKHYLKYTVTINVDITLCAC